jgi:hypothetical protein
MDDRNIDDIFSGMMADAGIEEPAKERFIRRTDTGFSNTLPPVVRENLLELCHVAATMAAATAPPEIYGDSLDQAAYALLSGDSLVSSALEDCQLVATSVMSDVWDEATVLALVRMTNSVRSALTSSVKSPDDLKHLRATSPEIRHLLDFLGAVQHEALDALM